MSRSEGKFGFRNLQPLSYLRHFNKMVDHNVKNPMQLNPRKELRTVSLTKFPLPQYYQNMEGIFESATRKKVEQVNNQHSQKQMEDQQFVKKHNQFMRKVLTKFIEHNQSRQTLLEQDRRFVKRSQEFKSHVRSYSQSKVSIKKKEKFVEPNPEANCSEVALATKGSIDVAEQTTQEASSAVLPVLKPRKKKQKFAIRKDNQIEDAMVARKLATPVPAAASQMGSKQLIDEPLDFKEDIMQLERLQAGRQGLFAQKVEKQIAQFDRKMDMEVHAIRYCNFWREPVTYELATPSKKEKKADSGSSGYAQSPIDFRNSPSK